MREFITYFIAPVTVAMSILALTTVSSIESKTNVNSAIIEMIKSDLDKINNKLDTIATRGCK